MMCSVGSGGRSSSSVCDDGVSAGRPEWPVGQRQEHLGEETHGRVQGLLRLQRLTYVVCLFTLLDMQEHLNILHRHMWC